MGVPTSDLQDFFEIQMQVTMKKEFNFKIQNYFSKSITKHKPPYTKQPISSSFLDQIECFS
jgi:hypothetical protein